MKEKTKKLYRSRTDKIIAGVCGGLGEYFNTDPVLIRMAFLLLVFINGLGILLYLVLMIVIPRESGEEAAVSREEKLREFAEKAGEKAQSVAGELAEEARSVAGEFRGRRGWFSERKNVFGAVIIIVGLIILANQLALIPGLVWKLALPAAIILAGVFVIVRKTEKTPEKR